MPTSRTRQLIVLFVLLCCTCGCSVTHAVRLKDHREIEVQTMVSEVANAPIVFVGEHHDVAAHHRLQLEVIKGLQKRGKRVAIGVEMFEITSQRALDAWVAGKVSEESFERLFELSWRNLPWRLYDDIFLYARDQHIPVLGLNAPREIVQQVAKQGFESLSAVQRHLLPPGAADKVSQSYLDFIGAWYPSHGRSGDAFRHICEAQALRNRVMAYAVREYASRHPESTVVVLAGAGHARHKGGVPMELPGEDFRIIVPPLPGMTDAIATDDADYLLVPPLSERLF